MSKIVLLAITLYSAAAVAWMHEEQQLNDHHMNMLEVRYGL